MHTCATSCLQVICKATHGFTGAKQECVLNVEMVQWQAPSGITLLHARKKEARDKGRVVEESCCSYIHICEWEIAFSFLNRNTR